MPTAIVSEMQTYQRGSCRYADLGPSLLAGSSPDREPGGLGSAVKSVSRAVFRIRAGLSIPRSGESGIRPTC